MVSRARCGTLLYRFLVFALFLTLNSETYTIAVTKAIKSTSEDDITNELLKHGYSVFIRALKSCLTIYLMMDTSKHAGMKV